MTSKLPETPQPSAIRTFLIADIRGWTRFTRELGDEAASRLAAKFAQIVGEGVEAWGGQLLELRGDEAMCTFESARRALRCAVELQEAFADETAVAPELPLNVGIGLDAGEAVPVGDGYRGTALNVAARLCSVAAAGEVIATGSLAHLAGQVEGLTFADLDAKPMKGFDQPVPAVLVDSATPHEHDEPVGLLPSETTTPPLPPELDLVVPLIARSAELRWLSWHWRRARHGHGGVVAITGTPGIGCTRLVAELAASGHREGAVVAYVRGEEAPVPPDDAALVIVDDLDRMPPRRARQLFGGLATGLDRRLLIAVEHIRDRGTDAPAVERLVSSDRVRRLGPIDVDGVVQISRLYLDEPGTDVPAQLLFEESDGIPSEVHRVASQWARATASRKLGESARRTSRERRELRAAEAAMIDDVERLEAARERTRLFVPLADPAVIEPSARANLVCPYKGLAAFDAADAGYFFGRERLIAELVARMVGSSFIGLVGASGSGKSSTLQAGLLPALATGVIPGSDEWIQVPMRPGDHPMAELRASLARHLSGQPTSPADPAAAIDDALAAMRPAQRLLLIVDQFEELFQVRDGDEQVAFVDLLTSSRAGMKVLVSLRADHYERCAAFPRLARLIGAEQVLVGPLSTDELRSVIRHPAERAGLRVDAELVDALVADVSGEPGGLPLLSTALLELWETRDDGRMTLAAYRATGGVRGAVARLAEGVYGHLDAEQQAVARTIFLRLAGEGEGGAVVRRRVRLEELDVADRPETAETLAALTSGRLVTTTDGFVEVAHEALLREWPRLRGWIEDDSTARQLRLHLMQAARTWNDGGREDGDLYRGARLAAIMDWVADRGGELNAVERSFIEESRAASEREAERQRRINGRLRGLVGGTAALLLVAAGAGAFGMAQARTADEQRRLAEEHADAAETAAQQAAEQALLAHSRELAQSAIAVFDQDPELSMLLAIEALETGGDLNPEAVTTLHRAVQASRRVAYFEIGSVESVIAPDGRGVHLTGDGSRLYVARSTRSFDVFEVGSGAVVDTYGTSAPDALPHSLGIAVTSDGNRAAMTGEDGVARVWTLSDGSEQQLRAPGVGSPQPPAFSPDGRLLAVVTFATEERDPGDMFVTVWDLDTGRELHRLGSEQLFEELDLYNVEVLFHPDGQRILLASCDCLPEGGLRWWHFASGAITENLVSGIPLTDVTVSPDGQLIATADADRKVALWDADTGQHVRTFRGHRDVVLGVTFSIDGNLLASTGSDATVRVWDVHSEGDASGIELMSLRHAGRTLHASFSDAGPHLAVVTSADDAHVWDVSRERAAEVSSLDPGWARVMSLDVGGPFIAAMGRSCSAGFCLGEALVYEPDSGAVSALEGVSALGVGITPDGSGLFAQTGEQSEDDSRRFGPIGRYATGDLTLQYELAEICAVSFPAPGEMGCGEPPATPWDEHVVRVVVSQDSRFFAITGNSRAISLWDSASGRLLRVIKMEWVSRGASPNLGLAISADAKLLAVSTYGPSPAVVVLRTESMLDADVERLELLSAELQALEESADASARASERESLQADMDALVGVVRRFDVDGWALDFSPDGSFLAVGSPDGSRVYDLESGTIKYELRGSWGLDVSADGSRIVTLDTDGAARLWDFPSGQELQEIPAITEGIGDLEGAVRFTNEDRHIVVTDAGVLKVLTLDVDELVEIARSRLTRQLSLAECQKYLHVAACGDRSRD